MLTEHSPSCTLGRRLLLLPAAMILAMVLVDEVAIPPHATTYVSHEDSVTYFTTARPAALGGRCYEETTGTALCTTGQTCIETGRTSTYHVIQMEALHTQLCTSVCCPVHPPAGTCYKKWRLYSCAVGYTTAYSSVVYGSLCCVPGSCFWFQTSLTNCDCPAGYMSVDRTDSCSAWGWALCCPEDADMISMQLSDTPFETKAPPPAPVPAALISLSPASASRTG